jgi:hypothetical protein
LIGLQMQRQASGFCRHFPLHHASVGAACRCRAPCSEH